MTTGYLGPRGTFCQAALLRTLDDPAADVRPMPSVDAALSAVRSGELDAAMVPIENSVEGGVPATMDALGSGSPLQVVAEALLPVTFVLAARPGTALADVRRVGSHPHGWAQCRGWVAAHLPGAAYVPALSTAAAAEALSLPGEPPHDAALCAPIAAETFGLDVLARDVGDTAGAVTRFLLVTRPGPPPARTGADRTSVVVFQADDHPGGLLEPAGAVRHPRHQPDPHRVAAHRRRARPLLLLDRRRRPRRRRPHGRGAHRAPPHVHRGAVPRLVPPRRRGRGRGAGEHERRRLRRRRRLAARRARPLSVVGEGFGTQPSHAVDCHRTVVAVRTVRRST
ncbi:hypothetical protein GCM10025868_21790 [Angustibacter aerolatus]|uniref:prephenate dehydratase n=1 Tax=Angustibacter aerolatus TaxID=1162965 RepID=A0ABQ6JIJ9_9ACTN|nr:hypothetical protein GCM10025868_21790 [Angustibacter aerolatus]